MTKKVTAFIISACILFSLPASAFGAGNVAVSIDGSNVAFTNTTGRPFVDSANRTLVPLRITMEDYGCEVFWDNENNRAIVYKDGVTVVCPIGEKYIIVNGETLAIDTAAVITGGRTYLPIRSVLESVGASVGWKVSTKTVEVKRGETDVLLDQQEYINRAFAAIDSNSSLKEQYVADAKKAVTTYLQNIPVDEAQIAKMCTRLELIKFQEGVLGEELAGYYSSKDNKNYTITLDTITEGKIKDNAARDAVVFHELCHVFSNTQTSKWFQEGMTATLENDIVLGGEMSHTIYDIYYRIISVLTELLGTGTMLEAYLTGNESIIFNQLNKYAGVTNSKALLNTNAELMTKALTGGVFTWMGKSEGKTEEQWKSEYVKAAGELRDLFEKAYLGKYGSGISDNPMLSVYLNWLGSFNFIETTRIISDPTVYDSETLNYYSREDRRYFTIIDDEDKTYSQDGQVVYYR